MEQQKHKTSGMFDLAFVVLMYKASSMAVVDISSEFSRHSSEIFEELLLFLYFIFDNHRIAGVGMEL